MDSYSESKKTSSVAKTIKYSIDYIVKVSFCLLRCDGYVRTIVWRSSDIHFPCKYETLEKNCT